MDTQMINIFWNWAMNNPAEFVTFRSECPHWWTEKNQFVIDMIVAFAEG